MKKIVLYDLLSLFVQTPSLLPALSFVELCVCVMTPNQSVIWTFPYFVPIISSLSLIDYVYE